MKQYLEQMIVGKKLTAFREEEGQLPEFVFEDTSIFIFGHWRILNEEGIVTGSDTRPENKLKWLTVSKVIGSQCDSADVDERTMDLTLSLSSSCCLHICAFSYEYEVYNIIHEDGSMLIGGPSDSWSAFGPRD
ncbi:hypothetical protein JJB07_09755 [Tumebacillus sp. ITR2]|uniref:Uncharacterized protein n=1 Tax=Tumebacillus amylolyticus TaxID=2801339 RepID=A0ABS1JBF2_9BACL|nr:hypothetical protein [Tumebacillus amylolyticus]MBL0386938.1 hypothetical protein [Tumebacillus amylolyticus]